MIFYSLVLEIAVALVMLVTLVSLWHIGRRDSLKETVGWRQVLGGFLLLTVGALVDLTDHFPELGRFIIFGQTPYQAFVEKFVGSLGGFVLLFLGLWRWLPHVVDRRAAEDQMLRARRELEEQLRQGSQELNLRELDLEREIRQRQEATQALARSQILLEKVLSNAPVVLLATDEVGVVTLAKGEALQSAGFGTSELEGRSLLEVYPEVRTGLERALAGEMMTDTLELGDRVFAYRHSPWINEIGNVKGVVTVAVDVTDLHRAKDELLRAKEKAEEANRAKTRFLANMSHELRTPLNSVIGFANVLTKNKSGALAEKELHYVERIRDNGKHLLSLVNDILDLSRIESGHVTLELVPLDLREMVESTVLQLRPQIAGRKVVLRSELPESVHRVRTDSVKLRQVLINLVGNALKFTEEGEVRIRLTTDPVSDIPRHLEVIDTGIGIPRESLGRIFEAFHQVDASTSRSHGGAGLGLSISRSLCRLLGYELTAESEIGEGTTFCIDLTGAMLFETSTEIDAPTLPPMELDGSLGEGLAGKRVLVIDDSSDSRHLLTEALGESGCEVLSAQDGDEGFWLARREKPDLILLDLMMPTMDGWDVLASLKRDSELAEIPVVVVSAIAKEQRGVLLGAIEALSKPVDTNQLRGVLQRLILSEPSTVLVVEDEESTRLMLAQQLRKSGYRVVLANNGREALERLEESLPDLVLVDLVMPEMDGTTLIHAMRADRRFRNLPVTVVTGRKLSSEEWHDLERYVSAILAKSRSLDEELARVLKQQRSGRDRR